MKITGKTTMKITRKIAITAMAASMACTLVPAARPMTAQAAAKDVTKTLKDRSKVKKMTSWFEDWAYYQVCYGQPGKHKKKTYTYKYSSAANRRDFLRVAVPSNVHKYDYYGRVAAKYAQLWSKRIFGCSTSGLEAYNGGDWGTQYPSLGKTKIYKLSAKSYQVRCYIYEHIESGVSGWKTRKAAKLTINLSRKSGSYFGYVAKSAKIYSY